MSLQPDKHTETAPVLDRDPHPRAGRKIILLGALPLLALGCILSILAYMQNPARFPFAYLVGFSFVWSIVLGCVFFIAMNRASAAVWSVSVRRVAEMFALSMPLVAILFIPIIFSAKSILPWTNPEYLARFPEVGKKSIYLNFPFFLVRDILCFALWILFAFLFIRGSLRQDAGKTGPEATLWMKKISPGFLLIFAATVSFAAFDWLMSLDPNWYSTIFSVYIFAGIAVAALSVISLAVLIMRRAGLLGQNVITPDHIYNLGGWLFAFTCFWGYIGLSQYLLIWYGNLPEESIWYIRREKFGAAAMAYAIMTLRFVIPFVVLIGRNAKKSPTVLGTVACITLAGQWLDLQWIVMPSISPTSPAFHLFDIGPVLLLSGLVLLVFGIGVARYPAIPINDPLLTKSLRFKLKI